MKGKDIYKIWAKENSKWANWIRPVPFVGINENMKIYEFARILGILLDNAIEASSECEEKIHELTGAKSRCIPFEQEHLSDTCVCCGKPAKTMVVWGRQY